MSPKKNTNPVFCSSWKVVKKDLWTILCFLTDLLIYEMQASAWASLCRLYTDTRALAHTWQMQPIIQSRPKASAMDAMAMPHSHLFISLYLLGPTDNVDPPQVHRWGHFLQSERVKTFMLSAMMCCCPSFFLFHGRALRFQITRRKVCPTQWTVPRASLAKHFGPRTQLCCSLSNCPNQVDEVKVCPIKSKVRQTFYRFTEHPELGL